jgi:hypothetical protein
MITPGHEAAAAEVDWQAQGRTADTAEVRAPAGGAQEIYAGHADWGHAPQRTPEGAAEGGSCGETYPAPEAEPG